MPIISGGSGGGGGGLLISDQTVGVGGAASIVFTTFPSSFRSLLLLVDGRSDAAAATANLWLRFNADTGANYDDERIAASAASPTSTEDLAQVAITIGTIPAATATAGLSTGMQIFIPNYSGSTFQKWCYGGGGTKDSTATTHVVNRTALGCWRNTAAITTVTILPATGNWVQGSRASLLGL